MTHPPQCVKETEWNSKMHRSFIKTGVQEGRRIDDLNSFQGGVTVTSEEVISEQMKKLQSKGSWIFLFSH